MRVVLIEAGRRFAREERFEVMRRFLAAGGDPYKYEDPHRDRYVNSTPFYYPLNGTRVKAVGGKTLRWGGVAQRLHESDFRTATLYRTGPDWPISYDDLEPFYGWAERELGVAGDSGAPSPRRSSPYPLPPFPAGFGDRVWRSAAEKLGIRIGPAAYAKNSVPYAGRPACQTYSVCTVCPIGAQYSAEVHVEAAERGGCQLFTETVARRFLLDEAGRVRAVFASRLDGSELEIRARHFVIAAHAVESARLLLLSGIGKSSDQIGRNLMEHWYVGGRGYKDERSYPGRIGFHILESADFYDRPDRTESGAIELEFSTGGEPLAAVTNPENPIWGKALADYDCREFGHWISVSAETEQRPHPESRVTLNTNVTDVFGDPVPNIHFYLTERERRTRERALDVIETILKAAGAADLSIGDSFQPAAHHMGTCRMRDDPEEGVVDRDLRVHGTSNLYVSSSAVFPTSGAVQPTLTIAALSLRLVDTLTSAIAGP